MREEVEKFPVNKKEKNFHQKSCRIMKISHERSRSILGTLPIVPRVMRNIILRRSDVWLTAKGFRRSLSITCKLKLSVGNSEKL